MSSKMLGEEPVPEVTQFAILSFLSGVLGFLAETADVKNPVKLTAHRVLTHGGCAYLQQACGYISTNSYQNDKAGRIFKGGHGITGKALMDKCTWRTKKYDSISLLEQDLVLDIVEVGDKFEIASLPRSWLAAPLLNQGGEVVMIVYAFTDELNFFANDERVRGVQRMITSFGNLNGFLEKTPMERVRNFSVPRETFASEDTGVYRRIQERFAGDVATKMEAGFLNAECSPA